MIDFSSLQGHGADAIRKLLDLIPPDTILPILQGTTKGLKWIKGSGVNGYWLGSYEYERQKKIINETRKGDVFYDVGAHVGFYTLLASRIVGESGHVYSFEPDEKNFSYLKRHVEMNNIKNVTLFQVAVSNYEGTAHLVKGDSTSVHHIEPGEGVKVIRLDKEIESGRLPPPTVVKIDVEGEEENVVEGLGKYMPSHSFVG